MLSTARAAAEGGVVQHEPERDVERDHRDDAVGHHGGADAEVLAEDVQKLGLRGQVSLAHRGVFGIDQADRHDDVPRAQRHDEGRQLGLGHQQAVDQAAARANADARSSPQVMTLPIR